MHSARLFFVPDFRDRLSALAELRRLVCAAVHGFPYDVAVPLKRIACPENREQKTAEPSEHFVPLPRIIKMIPVSDLCAAAHKPPKFSAFGKASCQKF